MQPTTQSNRYIAIILYESASDKADHTPTYEESFMLVNASSPEEARAKAKSLAQQRHTSFTTVSNERLTWSLKHVVDVNQLLTDKTDDGAEIYSRHFKNYDAYHAFEPLLGGSVG